ncbi:MAG: 4Fe-4S dicluster domain-containing protein [Planctomycetaceae bacterium]|nr:4Fe-4S dicluster domain-containing protein [Planctomycetaceae bacterium]
MLSESPNETSRLVDWVIPKPHFLESWGDARAYDGTASIIQPMISPLYPGLSEIELLASLLGNNPANGYSEVRKTWERRLGQEKNSSAWQQALADGVIEETAFAPVPLSIEEVPVKENSESSPSDEWDVIVKPDPTIWDGRFANNGWLQELPKPLTHVVWDNTAWIAPADAEQLKLSNRDLLEISHADETFELPVWIVPGHARGCVTVFAGYGRDVVGRVGNQTGYPVKLNSSSDGSVTVRPVGRRSNVVTTQHHQTMEGRNLARAGTVAEFLANTEQPEFAHPPSSAPDATMYQQWSYDGHKWGMTIDLTACVGCSACVIACQSENNIPVVGKEQCDMNRHMHWIRVDTYHKGSPEQPEETLHQPVPCMHCEHAPCEVVCPVAATNHSDEGLNQMIYNRCVGTRYCSNNCPYKVRRFNFFDFSDAFLTDPKLDLLSNPEVTVRERGVMEKCTYCVQRIENARIHSQVENRELADGDIRTACQTACPAEAIRFGDLNDPQSKVHETAQHSLNYGLLEELNVRPRTTYLTEVTNPKEAPQP